MLITSRNLNVLQSGAQNYAALAKVGAPEFKTVKRTRLWRGKLVPVMNTVCLIDFLSSGSKMARVGIVWYVDGKKYHVLCIFSIGYNEDVSR